MEHFRSIINKGKKFAKPELKSCIEEFEDKVNKFHIEKKDQEITAKNAQAHKERVESYVVSEKGAESGESEIVEDSVATGPLTDFSKSESKFGELNESSHISGEVTGLEVDENEVQSPYSNRRGCKSSQVSSYLWI